MKVILIVASLLLVITLVAGYKFSRFGVESPQYRVVQNDGPFEIREYPSMVLVSTAMEDAYPNDGGSFMRLFGYISGENEAGQKIAMTTPVMMSTEDGEQRMSFIVPQEIAADGAPDSGNKLVEKEKMAAGSYATYRFSGSRDKDRYAAAQSKLLSWLRQQNRTPRGAAIIASYDPPYTPSFLRRNEILIPLQ